MTRTDSIINVTVPLLHVNNLRQTVDDFSAFSALTYSETFLHVFLSLSHSPTYILYVYLQKL